MTMHPLRDRASIIGIGWSPFGRFEDRSALSLAAEALREAVRDAGIGFSDIDGIIVNAGPPVGVDYDVLCERLGLDVRYAMQTWAHGRFVGPCLQDAAMALHAGLADCVAIVSGTKFSSTHKAGRPPSREQYREGGGVHGEAVHYGLAAAGSGAAMAYRRYSEKYAIRDGDLGVVPVTLRDHAALNAKAVRRDPITIDDYLESRFIIDPLRIYDFSLVTDGGCALLVTRTEDALRRTDRPPPVHISGIQGLRSSREEFLFGRPGLGVQQQTEAPFTPTPRDVAVYEYAGIARDEIDGFYTYDAFSPLVWFALERFGFCGEGEAADYCADGGIRLGGHLPVNTNGGLLSEGHLMGWNHFIEMVIQLRGAAGKRQISGANALQWGTVFGDSVILRR